MKTVLCAASIRKEFLGGVAKNEAKVVKRFVDEHAESSLKTKPKVSAPDCFNLLYAPMIRVLTVSYSEGYSGYLLRVRLKIAQGKDVREQYSARRDKNI
jgi:hypothetical protein